MEPESSLKPLTPLVRDKRSRYSGLQNHAPSVGAILVIAHTLRAKTSFAPTRTGSHERENRYRVLYGHEPRPVMTIARQAA
jgi:hypothetical protein